MRNDRLPKRLAVSLAELVITIAGTTVLMLGLASSIRLSSSAFPSTGTLPGAVLTTAKALDTITSELSFATSVTSDVTLPAASRSISFQMPDCDGVAPATETVTYSWSGVAGDPLLRTYNGVSSNLLNDVREFTLAYDKRVETVVNYSSDTSAETLLMNNDGSTTTADSSITTSNWCGQYFQPLLPQDATAWNVTRVELMARLNGATTGQNYVQICTANNGLPTNTVLSQQTLLESTLTSSYVLRSLSFSGVPMQPANQGLCLVVKFASNGPSGYVQYWAGGKKFTNYFSTTNSGGTWTPAAANSLRCKIYGCITSATATNVPQYRLANVRCTVRVGNTANGRVNHSFRVLNEPVVTGP